jgi:hypothetical protein
VLATAISGEALCSTALQISSAKSDIESAISIGTPGFCQSILISALYINIEKVSGFQPVQNISGLASKVASRG